MTEETTISPEVNKNLETASALDSVQETMTQFLEAANVTTVYGEPVTNGDVQVIPAAEVLSFMGFGVGHGSGTSQEGGQENVGSGSGGGGGGRVLSRPVAVVINSPEGVRVEPVVDVTKIALAALTAAGFMISMLFKMTRGPSIRE